LSFSKQPLPRSLSGRPPYTSTQGSSPFIPGSFERDSPIPSSASSQPPQIIKRYSSSLGQSQRARVSSYGSSAGEGTSVPGSQPQNLLRRSSTRMSTESGLRHSLETPDPAGVNVPDDDDIQSFLKTLDSLPQPPSLAAQAATTRARQPSASSSLSNTNTSIRQASSPLQTSSAGATGTGPGTGTGRAPVTRAQVDDAVRKMTGSFAASTKTLEQSNVMSSTRLDTTLSNRSTSATAPSVGLLTASRPSPVPRRVSPASLSAQAGRRSSIDDTASSSPPVGRSASVKKNSPLSGEPLQPPTPGPVIDRPLARAPVEADSQAVQTALPQSPPPTASQMKSTARSLPAGPAPLAQDSPVPIPGRPGLPASGFLSPQPTGSASKRDTIAGTSQRRGPVLLRGGFDGRSQSGQRHSTSPSRSPIRDFSRLAVGPGSGIAAPRIPASTSVGVGISGEQHAEAELIGWRRYRSEQRIQMAGGRDVPPLEEGVGGVRRQSMGAGNALGSGGTMVQESKGDDARRGQGQRTAPSSLGRYRQQQQEQEHEDGSGGVQ
jgi:autophagy-related protein 13